MAMYFPGGSPQTQLPNPGQGGTARYLEEANAKMQQAMIEGIAKRQAAEAGAAGDVKVAQYGMAGNALNNLDKFQKIYGGKGVNEFLGGIDTGGVLDMSKLNALDETFAGQQDAVSLAAQRAAAVKDLGAGQADLVTAGQRFEANPMLEPLGTQLEPNQMSIRDVLALKASTGSPPKPPPFKTEVNLVGPGGKPIRVELGSGTSGELDQKLKELDTLYNNMSATGSPATPEQAGSASMSRINKAMDSNNFKPSGSPHQGPDGTQWQRVTSPDGKVYDMHVEDGAVVADPVK